MMKCDILHAPDLLWGSNMPCAEDGSPLLYWALEAYQQGVPVVVRRVPLGTDGKSPVGLKVQHVMRVVQRFEQFTDKVQRIKDSKIDECLKLVKIHLLSIFEY